MKTLTIPAALLVAAVAFTAPLHSQAPAAPKTSQELLQEMKTRNQQMLEKQTQTLLKLEELQKAAQQIKALGART